jgi:hypothetical protein
MTEESCSRSARTKPLFVELLIAAKLVPPCDIGAEKTDL